MKKYILAFDQGTTSSRAIIFDKAGNIVGRAQKEFNQIYLKAGYVEHDPVEIWATQSGVARETLEIAGIRGEEIAAIGIANQRETTILWDKTTGKPIYNGVVWQCRRSEKSSRRIRISCHNSRGYQWCIYSASFCRHGSTLLGYGC